MAATIFLNQLNGTTCTSSRSGKDSTMKQPRPVLFCMMIVLVLSFTSMVQDAKALTVSSLDFTSGAVNFDGRYGRILDRLFAEDGTITMGSYQSMSDIVDPITRGHKTFFLFTSGLSGAPAPSAAINGSSMSVDLSSLFFGWTRGTGNEIHAWNIGGMATGLFNPQTNEFSLSWDHLFNSGNGKWKHESMRDHSATFFLQGTAVVGQAPVPLSASLIFFATGLGLLGGLCWRRAGTVPAGVAS